MNTKGFPVVLGTGLMLVVTSTATNALSRETAERAARPAGLSVVPRDAQPAISAALGRDSAAYRVHARGGSLSAANAQRSLHAVFATGHVSVSAGSTVVNVRLAGYGRATALASVAAVAPHSRSNSVEYRRGPLTEWYVNGPLGLEQGFTFARAPSADRRAPLTVGLTLSGPATPSMDPGATGLTFKSGSNAIRYAGLSAWDANGKKLHAWMELRGRELLIEADDAQARYPVTIDPTFQIAELTYSDSGASLGDAFGYSAAISGNTIVVGAPYYGHGRGDTVGRAYVFVEPQGGWQNATQTATLSSSAETGNTQQFGLSVAIDKDTIVVGMLPADEGVDGDIASYASVFVKPKTGWVDTTETADLVSSNGYGLGTVAISGDTVVAGAPSIPYSCGPQNVYYGGPTSM